MIMSKKYNSKEGKHAKSEALKKMTGDKGFKKAAKKFKHRNDEYDNAVREATRTSGFKRSEHTPKGHSQSYYENSKN